MEFISWVSAHAGQIRMLCVSAHGCNYTLLSVVLPDPPDITVNSKTGCINFSSPFTDRISVDYYQVVILDITGNEVINSSIIGDSSSVGDLFQHTTCSPYQVTVKAHNSYGSTESNNTVNGNRQGGKQLDKYSFCIAHENTTVHFAFQMNVTALFKTVIFINFIIVTKSIILCTCTVHADVINLLAGEESGITMVVNCSQTYVSDVELNITIQHMGNTINSSLVVCNGNSYITIESLKCNNEYDFLILWSSASAGRDLSQCQISINSQVLHCSGMC